MQEIQAFADRLDRAREMIPDIRREVLETAGDEMLSAVRGRIGGTGKVQRWQEKYMGSGGGYVAVRPRAQTFTEATRKKPGGYAVGYVTNSLESGHRQNYGQFVPTLQRKLLRLRVSGRYMYRTTKPDVKTIANRAAREVEQRLAAALEG